MKKLIVGGASLLLGVIIFGTKEDNTMPIPRTPVKPPAKPKNLNELEPGDHLWFWNGKVSFEKNIPQLAWFGTTAPNDYKDNGINIYYYVMYENEVRKGQPHMLNKDGTYAWLHNNPGNITGPQPNYGQYQDKYGWHNFMTFPTYQAGFDAIAKYLRGPIYRSLNLIQAFNKYAPKGDGGNDPDRYAKEVASAAGVSPFTLIHDLTPEQMRLAQEKIAYIERGRPGKILTIPEFMNEIKAANV